MGAPSNTFNGYLYEAPDGDYRPMPHPRNLRGIRRYMHGDAAHPPLGTHDVYWGNFIDPAIRLFTQGIARPRPGDLVTFAVWIADYEKRGRTDYRASPYNTYLHINSIWVAGNRQYDPRVLRTAQGRQRPPEPPEQPPNRVAKPAPVPPPASEVHPEHVLDHDILMRSTQPNDVAESIIHRPRRPQHYLEILQDVPLAVAYGIDYPGLLHLFGRRLGNRAPRGLLVKLLLVRSKTELIRYLAKGTWSGDAWTHPFDEHDLDQPDPLTSIENVTHAFAATQPPAGAERHWLKLPAVDRRKVKIRRLDYFGHSDHDSLYLSYGTTNAKGEEPVSDLYVTSAELVAALDEKAFHSDAYAQLWGCYLAGSFAKALSPFFAHVRASVGVTRYGNVIPEPLGMPVPASGWTDLKRAVVAPP